MRETFLEKFLIGCQFTLVVWKLFQLSFLGKFLIGCQFGGLETFK